MLKDKNRDLVRAILPSKARKSARDEGKSIRRARRRAEKVARTWLDPEDYDDSAYMIRVGMAEPKFRSRMEERVYERRGADKLGALYQITQNKKKKLGSDELAREYMVKAIQPSKNLITRHAMTHVDNWLECPEASYYLPPETERDVQFRENRYNTAPVIWGEADLKRIVRFLWETDHKALNRCLKRGVPLLKKRECDEDLDECTYTVIKRVKKYAVYDPAKWMKWRPVMEWQVDNLHKAGERVRSWVELVPEIQHDDRKCKNWLLISGKDDIDILVRKLGSATEQCFIGAFPRSKVLHALRIQAKKFGLYQD